MTACAPQAMASTAPAAGAAGPVPGGPSGAGAAPAAPDTAAAPGACITPQACHHRAMTVGDVDAVMAVEVRAYSHPWSRGNFIDSLAAGHLAEVCVDADGHVVGYFVALPGVDELHLLNLTVAPPHHGHGHGSALLNAVLRHAQARQLASVWLEVRESNEHARRLYARRGFEEVGRRRGYYPAHHGREDAVVMRHVPGTAAAAATCAGATEPDNGAMEPR